MKMNRLFWSVLAVGYASVIPAQAQLTIAFDYTYDTLGFFTDNARKNVLESAASAFESRITDTLSGITQPGSGNTWSTSFSNPADGATVVLNGPVIPANTLVIYVGGRDLPGSTLGQGGFGGFGYGFTGDATGTAWDLTVRTRGESGANTSPKTDFAPWGGSISFDTVTTWYFDSDVSTSDVPGGQVDFYSVALHELGHVLGYGASSFHQSWSNKISASLFSGANAKAANGDANVPIDVSSQSHWAEGTMSVVPGTLTAQEAAMDPSITGNARKVFTDLDWAGLQDIGWEVSPVPEPAEVAGVTALGLLGFAAWRRKRAQPGPAAAQS